MSTPGKDTIYIDVDDEITAIIEKVKGSKHKIVALVLPKRATVLQSIVNMKLLKRGADSAKKSLVLITSEAGLMPLAGAVGVHVAKNLQSKPVVPSGPSRGDNPDTPEDESLDDDSADDDAERSGAARTAAAGAAGAGVAAFARRAAVNADDDTETIEFDNEIQDAATEPETSRRGKKDKKAKAFKIPNFDRFRMGILIAVVAVLGLFALWFVAFVMMPKAVITIKTDAETVSANVTLAASENFKEVDIEGRKVPAVKQQIKKTDTEKVQATGKKDIGSKAKGTISIKNCEDSDPHLVSAGSSFTAGGKSFLADDAVTVPGGQFSGGGANCNSAAVSVPVSAAENGDSYNLAAQAYTNSMLVGKFTISGSAMSGGSSNVVSVVSQEDVDKAKEKMQGRLDTQGKDELKANLASASLIGLDDTLVVSQPVISASPAVGDQATEATVTSAVTYDVVGVKQTDVARIIKGEIEKQIDTAKQTVLDDGLKEATIRTTPGNNQLAVSIQTTATAGTRIDEAAIKDQAKGKKRGDVEKQIGSLPGVKDVTVEYKPFWVMSTPKSSKKITIVLQKSQQEGKPNNGNNP